MIRPSFRLAMALATLAAVSACAVGPDYQRPEAATPGTYKEIDGWKPSEPQDLVNRGPWWTIYDDPVLDGLARQIEISNQTLKAADAAFREARAMVGEGRAGFFPTVTLDASGQRWGQGSGGGGTSSSGGSRGRVSNQFNLTAGASWELDVWGRIRRTVESDVAGAQASAADLAAARLSAQATLVTDYFQLRVDDELKPLLDDTVEAFAPGLHINQDRYDD